MFIQPPTPAFNCPSSHLCWARHVEVGWRRPAGVCVHVWLCLRVQASTLACILVGVCRLMCVFMKTICTCLYVFGCVFPPVCAGVCVSVSTATSVCICVHGRLFFWGVGFRVYHLQCSINLVSMHLQGNWTPFKVGLALSLSPSLSITETQTQSFGRPSAECSWLKHIRGFSATQHQQG